MAQYFNTQLLEGMCTSTSSTGNLSMVNPGRSPAAKVGRRLQRATRAVATQSNQVVDCGGSDPTSEESDAGVAADEMRKGLRPLSRRWWCGAIRSRGRGGQLLRLGALARYLAAALSDGGGSWGVQPGRGGTTAARRRRGNMAALFSRRRSSKTTRRLDQGSGGEPPWRLSSPGDDLQRRRRGVGERIDSIGGGCTCFFLSNPSQR
jgi:hypothetical protein